MLGKLIFAFVLLCALLSIFLAIATRHISIQNDLRASIREEKDKFGLEASRLLAQRVASDDSPLSDGDILCFRAGRLPESDCDTTEKVLLDCLEYIVASRYQTLTRDVGLKNPGKHNDRDKMLSAGKSILTILDKFRAVEKLAMEPASTSKNDKIRSDFSKIQDQSRALLQSLRETEKPAPSVTEAKQSTEFEAQPTISALFAPVAQLLPVQ